MACDRDAVECYNCRDAGSELLLADFQIAGLDRGVWVGACVWGRLGVGWGVGAAKPWIPALAFHPASLLLKAQRPSEGGLRRASLS